MNPLPVASGSPLVGIALKIASVVIFVAMSSLIKAAGQLPAGQIVFFRSFFAIFPILVVFAMQGQLGTALATNRPWGHLLRALVGVLSMGLGFFALTRLPLPEATTLNYAQPLFVVLFSALFLREAIRAYRWTAVAVGLAGVLVISWPKLSLFAGGSAMGHEEAAGVIAAFGAACMSAWAMLTVRSLALTEKTATIVLWFSLAASGFALLTLPFGWVPVTAAQALLLVLAGFCGGIAQILMTASYRHAEASTVAPFEYTSMLVAIAVGYVVFSEVPTVYTVVGGAIVVASGLFIIWRERQLGLERARAKQVSPPQ